MNLSFAEALVTLGRGAAFRIANAARAAADLLGNTLLPDRDQFTYNVESGNMTVRGTMPGLVGMDSPYPPTGAMTVSSFLERSAKIANEVTLTEETQRTLQDMLLRLGGNAPAGGDALAQEALNFLQAVVISPHMDVREYLKWQALTFGQIDWTFGQRRLLVDYGIPAGNKLTARAGNDAYHGSTSKFWEDVRQIRRLLRGYSQVRIFAHPDTIDTARYNGVNAMQAVAESDGGLTFRRYADPSAPGLGLSSDMGDTVQIISYGVEGEILNPADPRETLTLPFLSRGKLVGVGLGRRRTAYVPGRGAAEDPLADLALGYGHVAPTVEGGGSPGLWADMFTPEREPWQLVARGAQNYLPVIEDEKALAIATTAMP